MNRKAVKQRRKTRARICIVVLNFCVDSNNIVQAIKRKVIRIKLNIRDGSKLFFLTTKNLELELHVSSPSFRYLISNNASVYEG